MDEHKHPELEKVLCTIVANQETILKNQATLEQNQKAILANQFEILSFVQNVAV